MDKTKAALLSLGVALGAVGAKGLEISLTPSPYAIGLDVARLPTQDGSHRYATGAIHGGVPEWVDLGDGGQELRIHNLKSQRIDYTAEDQACLDGVLSRHTSSLR